VRKIFIYTLADPRTGEVRYVGKTIDTYYRLARHISDAKRSTRRHKDAWLKGIVNIGLSPVLEVLDECTDEDWKLVEQYWISQFKSWGFKLLNETLGGEGVVLVGRNKREKPIFQFDTDGNLVRKFDGFLDIKKEYPIFERQGIQECCLKRLRTYKGFIWTYDQDEIRQRVPLPRVKRPRKKSSVSN